MATSSGKFSSPLYKVSNMKLHTQQKLGIFRGNEEHPHRLCAEDCDRLRAGVVENATERKLSIGDRVASCCSVRAFGLVSKSPCTN